MGGKSKEMADVMQVPNSQHYLIKSRIVIVSILNSSESPSGSMFN